MGITDKIKSIQQEGTIVRVSRYEEGMQYTEHVSEFLLTVMKREFGKFYLRVTHRIKEPEKYISTTYKYTSIEERDKDWELITNYLDSDKYDGMWEATYMYSEEADAATLAISKSLPNLQEYMVSDSIKADAKKYNTALNLDGIEPLKVYIVEYDTNTGQPNIYKYLKDYESKCIYIGSKRNKDHYYTEHEIEPVYWVDFKIRQSSTRLL
jgi:hypothetical protein